MKKIALIVSTMFLFSSYCINDETEYQQITQDGALLSSSSDQSFEQDEKQKDEKKQKKKKKGKKQKKAKKQKKGKKQKKAKKYSQEENLADIQESQGETREISSERTENLY